LPTFYKLGIEPNGKPPAAKTKYVQKQRNMVCICSIRLRTTERKKPFLTTDRFYVLVF
jgi:hypothetical protein